MDAEVKYPVAASFSVSGYLNKGEEKAAIGGSQWKKYLHPKYQKRMFFPGLWSAEERAN